MRDYDHGEGRGRRDFGGHRGHRGDRGEGRRGGRMLEHGRLRLILLKLIADKPSHGYELIKEIEERMGGSYSPSPGVVYPTLTLLEELGYAAVTPDEGNRKLYSVTDGGRAFLAENADKVAMLFARMDHIAVAEQRPPQVVRAIENLRMAVHMRASRPFTDEQAKAFAAVLDQAVRELEQI